VKPGSAGPPASASCWSVHAVRPFARQPTELTRLCSSQNVGLVQGQLSQMTKVVLQQALSEEMAERPGCKKHDPAGRGREQP
jgi:hypothetical protein